MNLHDELIKAGVPADKAREISTRHAPSVDVTTLQKSLHDLREEMVKSTDSQAVMQAAIDEATSVTDAVVKGSDALLAEVRGQNAMLARAVLQIGETVDSIAKGLGQSGVKIEAIAKSLDAPVPPRSQGTLSTQTLPTPAEQGAGGTSRLDAINKALGAMPTAPSERIGVLSKAVALLESGADVDKTLREAGL